MDFLLNIDTQLFYFLNVSCANPVTDALFPLITKMGNWTLLVIFALLWVIVKDGIRGRFFLVAVVLAILISDQTSSNFLKHLFERPRPCHIFNDINLLVHCGKGFSFPSSHAVNTFMAVSLIVSFYKKYHWAFFTIGGLIALSRVFVGVHYPIDILCGSAIGLGLGYLWAYIVKRILSKTKYYDAVYMKYD